MIEVNRSRGKATSVEDMAGFHLANIRLQEFVGGTVTWASVGINKMNPLSRSTDENQERFRKKCLNRPTGHKVVWRDCVVLRIVLAWAKARGAP